MENENQTAVNNGNGRKQRTHIPVEGYTIEI